MQPASPKSKDVSPGAAVGIAIGSLVFGVLATNLLQYLLGRRRRSTAIDSDDEEEKPGRVTSQMAVPYPLQSILSSQAQAQAQTPEQMDPLSTAQGRPEGSLRRDDSQLYVVHHDAGGAPFTVYTGGREVTELPPQYDNAASASASPEPGPQRSASLPGRHTPTTSVDSGTSRGARRVKSMRSVD